MGAAWYRARRDLRRRWRATLALIVLVGIAGGAVLTLVAGARRSATSYDRFRAATLASDLDVTRDGEPAGEADLGRAISRLPQVAVIGRSAFPFVVPAGSGQYPYIEFLAIAMLDRNLGTTLDRPRVRAGRPPRPDRPDEIAVFSGYAREAGIHVGDRLPFESYAANQMEPLFTTGDAGPPAGPRFTFTVTGVFDAPTFLSESVGSFQPRVVLSAAFARAHAHDIATYPGGFTLRLRNGSRDVAAVTAALRRQFAGDPSLQIQPASEVDSKIGSSLDVIVAALLLCALAAAIAAVVVSGQAIARHFAVDNASARELVALGMTRRDRVVELLARSVPVAVGGALVAVVVALLASPLMPVGLARDAEPDPGFSFDGWVTGVGALAVASVVVALALGAAATLVLRPARVTRVAEARPSWRMRALSRTNLSPPATIGVGLAFEPRDGTAVAVRSAFGAVAFGAAGVVAVVVFIASLTTLVTTPARHGAPWDALVSGFSGEPSQLGGTLAHDPDVTRLAVLSSSLGMVHGDETNLYGLSSLKGGAAATVLDGRLPNARGEAALGTKTLHDLGAHIGGTVVVRGTGGERVDATIVGTAAFPVVDERSTLGRGVWLAPQDVARLAGGEPPSRDLVVAWRPGVDVAAARRALARDTGATVLAPLLPSDLNNLREVEALPRALAGFLACLAAVAAVHAFVATVRLRRRDLAVMRTLGFERRQLGSTVVWQATTIAAIGAVVGVPLGLLAGRLVWHSVAGSLGVVPRSEVPVLAVALVAVATFVVANLAAAIPARVASRTAPGRVLRAG